MRASDNQLTAFPTRTGDRYEALFDSAPVGIYQSTVDGRILVANRALAAMLGYGSPEELRAVSLRDVYARPDERDALIRRWTPSGAAADLDVEWCRRDGGTVWVRLTAQAVKGAEGAVAHFQGFVRDISEDRRVRERLRESEERYRALVEYSPDGVLVHREGRLLFANRAAARMLGYSGAGALVGRSLLSIVAPAFHDVLSERIAWVQRTAQATQPAPMLFRRADGTVLHVETMGVPVTFQGAPAIQVMARDMTERRELRERFELIARATNDAVWESDLRTGDLWWGDGFRTLFGYDAPDAPPDSDVWLSLIDPADRERVAAKVQRVLRGRTDRWEDQYRFRRADGTWAEVLDRGQVLRDADGAPTRMIGAMMDITELRRTEATLRQAQKMDAVGQLTGGIAHDFNNLLTVILANADLVASDLPASAELADELSDIRGAARRGQGMVKKLLGFARKTSLRLQVVDPVDAVHGAATMLRRVLPADIELVIILPEDLPPVRADASALEQILLNLATNARDAMEHGGVLRIEAHTTVLDEQSAAPSGDGAAPGEYVCVSVGDTGAGMDDAVVGRVFEPFFTTKPVGQGTGLGLAMVYGLVRQHGGFVRVESAPGAGTTLQVYLPAARGQDPAAAAAPAPETLPRGTETVLLAEDEPEVLRTTARTLTRYGYTVLTAPDGADAIDVFQEHRNEIALVLSDVVMPRMGGKALYDAVRAAGGDVPFLFASGYTARDVRASAVLDTDLPFLHKPWTVTDLLTRVRTVLDGRAA